MERQEGALAQWLADHPDYQLAEALVDAGVSAGSGKHRTRGALARFIEGGRTGAVPPGSCLVVESWSRFSREVATDSLGTLLNDVWGQGLAISFCTDGVVLTRELINREDYRLHGLLGAMGQARREWEERSRRSRGAIRKREELQDQGHRPRGRLPFWIERNASAELVISPTYGPLIQRAVELAISGLGMSLIAERLNSEGFPPPPSQSSRNQYRPEGGRRWGQGNISRVLRHPALIGTLERKASGDLPGYYPAAVTPERWAQLRASIDKRNSIKGAIRGKSHRAQNLFQTLLRCACCGGPVGYSPPAKRSRAGHPGYVACRNGAGGRNGCTMKGYIEYDRVEAHCLSRLGATDWEALLHRPEDEREQQRLGQEIASLELERDRQRAQLEMAERRAEDAWLQGDEERAATAERALKRLREALAAADDRLLASKQDLARLRARPQSVDQAAAMRTKVAELVASIRRANGAERLAFNRWLLTREPAIAFRLRIDADGPRDARWRRAQTEMFVGGESLGFEGVPIWTDKLAIEAGSPGLRQVVSVGQAGSVTLVNTAWVDAFDSQEAAAAKLRSAADANRDLAVALQRRGGDLDGSKGAVIEG
ncbi:recombinase family protein [Cyanobium sp. Aljojuca 7D2]|nr:recombinase family protein [Cyanobium sp. Aljojuca 7D2]